MAVTTNEVWDKDINYNIGDRVAQMVILPYPKVEFVEVDEDIEKDNYKSYNRRG